MAKKRHKDDVRIIPRLTRKNFSHELRHIMREKQGGNFACRIGGGRKSGKSTSE